MIPIGTKVQIRQYESNPGFWDTEGKMMKLAGCESIVTEDLFANRYKLKGYSWTWREVDLIPITVANDPNYAFKIRKRR